MEIKKGLFFHKSVVYSLWETCWWETGGFDGGVLEVLEVLGEGDR